MSGRVIAVSALGVLALLGVAWFLATHDRVVTQQWVGPQGDARLKDFLAAQRFAERMGFKVSELRSQPDLDALQAQAVLIMPRGRQQLPPSRLATLVAWVENGGHLIVEAEPTGVPDPLLEKLGVQRSSMETLRKPMVVELPQSKRTLSVNIRSGIKLETPQADVRLRAGPHLVSFARGRGLVTAASTLRFARNPGYEDHLDKTAKRPLTSIAAPDHAELVWTILSLVPSRDLQVYFRPERLSLWNFLRDNAAEAVIATLLLLALWIWSIVPRFGPVAPDAPPGRRRLLDHLRATGRYYWAKGMRSRLVVAARDAALRRVARAQPDFASASQAERAARLATLAGISKEDANRFMVAAGAMRGVDFIRLTQDAQRVHKALEKGNK